MDSTVQSAQTTGQHFERIMNVDQLRAEFKHLRKVRNLSQVHVAHLLGITQASLSAWETGKSQSLRSHTLNEVFQLVETWYAENNIVPMCPGRTEQVQRRDAKQARAARPDADDPVRKEMIEEIRASRGLGRAASLALAKLREDQLFDVYILSKRLK